MTQSRKKDKKQNKELVDQAAERLAEYYPAKEASKRLKEILRLRAKKQTIPDIINGLIRK